MTATSQHEFHPDAESLSAFAEQALSERERNHVLAHLAVCGRCRQVVALAQHAAELEVESEQLMAAAAPGPRLAAAAAVAARKTPGAWWRRWRLVWVPAAVTAAFAVTAVSVYLHQKEESNEAFKIERQVAPSETDSASAPPPAEMARVTPPSPPEQRPRAAEPSAKSAIPNRFTPPPAPQVPAALPPPAPKPEMRDREGFAEGRILAGRISAVPPASMPPAATTAPPAAASAQPPMAVTESVTVAQDQNAPQTTSATPTASELALQPTSAPHLYKTPPAASAPMLKAEEQKKLADKNRQMAAMTAKNADLAASNAAPQTNDQLAAEAQAPAVSSTQQVTVNAAAGSSLGAAGAFHGAANTRPLRLPSGLEVVSFALANRALVAIDKAGNVFLSFNSGNTWQPVSTQWTGRAVLVRTRPSENKALDPAATAGVSGTGSAGGVASPAQFFEIVNDQNQVWQSTDGIVWKAK
jgi:hypothetical protein